MRRRSTQRSRSVRRDRTQNVGVVLKKDVQIVPMIYKTPKVACFSKSVKNQQDTSKRTLRDAVIIPQMLDIYTGHAYQPGTPNATHWYCNYEYYFNSRLPSGVSSNPVSSEEAKKLIAEGIDSTEFEGNIRWLFKDFSEETDQPSGELLLYNGLYTKPQMYRFTGISDKDPIRYFMTVQRVQGLTGNVCNFNQSPSTEEYDTDDSNWSATKYYRRYEFDIIGWRMGQKLPCVAADIRYYLESFENNFIDDEKLVALNPILINGV